MVTVPLRREEVCVAIHSAVRSFAHSTSDSLLECAPHLLKGLCGGE